MIKKSLFWLFVPCCIAGGAIVNVLVGNGEAGDLQPEFLSGAGFSAPAPQRTGQRAWKPDLSRRGVTLGGAGEMIYFPAGLQVDEAGNIFVQDGGDQSIKKFSPEGRFLRKLGQGEGQGPGEFGALTDFALGEAGAVWAADASNGRITVFDADGRLQRTLPMVPPPYRMAWLGHDRLAIMFPLSGRDTLFGTAAYQNGAMKIEKELGHFLKDQKKGSLALEGWLKADGTGGFVYASLFPGLLASYGPDGGLRYFVKTIDPPPFPKIKRRSDGFSFTDRESRYSALSLSVTQKEIFILTLKEDGLKRLGVIDAYDKQNGRYLYSFRIPTPCKRAVVTDRHVYTLEEGHVNQWLR